MFTRSINLKPSSSPSKYSNVIQLYMSRKVNLKIYIIVTVSKNKKRGWFKAVVIEEFYSDI
jgi:hypothetical protein